MNNPLVAPKQDSTTWHTGIGIADDVAGVVDGIQSGSWVETGLSIAGAGMDLLSMAMNPVATLVQWGVSWLIEHVKPLQDMLNWLAGDADQVSAYAQTWKNVSTAVGQAATDLTNDIKTQTANWTGAAADAYRNTAATKIGALTKAAGCANGIGVAVEVAGVLVGVVRGMVRDLIGQAIGDFIQDALEEAGTLGFGTPAVIAQVVEQVAEWMEKISNLVKKLTSSFEKLKPLISKLEEFFQEAKKLLGGVKDGEEGAESGARSAAHDVTDDAPTTPSSADDAPTAPSSAAEPTTPTTGDSTTTSSADEPTGDSETTPQNDSGAPPDEPPDDGPPNDTEEEPEPENDFPPQEARDKVPDEWGEGTPNKKGVGHRWQDPENQGNGVRIDEGNPEHSLPSQQVDHVIVRKGGTVIGRDGNPISGSIKDDPENAHIPLSEWQNWQRWDQP